MELDNRTSFAGRLLRFQSAEGAPVRGAVIVKATFALESGRWVPAPEQVPIVDASLSTAFGTFHGDNFMRKDGVDLCVMGTVRPSRPRRAVEVSVAVGRRESRLVVYGDRRWVRAGGFGLLSSDPQPFQELPLCYERAYGGKTVHDYEEVVFPDNPLGRGYYLAEAEAEGQPLANIERAAEPPVRAWNDRPVVAGWGPYPCFWGLRAREAVTPDAEGLPRVSPRLNNNAHPDLILPALPDGAEVRIAGLCAAEVVYCVPRLSARFEVTAGGSVIAEPELEIDGVFVWADLDNLTVTARGLFSYPYNRGELRGARLWRGA